MPAHPHLSRRTLMKGAAAGLVALGGARHAQAGTGDDLHLKVAQRVRELVGNRAVDLRVLVPTGGNANVDPVAAAFKEATGVAVTLEQAPTDDINTRLILDKLNGDLSYDLALPASFGLPDLVAAGVIRPMTEYAKMYEPEGFREGVLYSVADSFDDEIYGFQTDGDAYLMFYNRPWMEDPIERGSYEDRFGASLEIPRTWAELDRQMAFFHRPDSGKYGGALFRTPLYLAWEWWIRFHAKGTWPLSPTMEPQIASDAGVSALEDMIRASKYLVPEAGRAGLFDNWRRFDRGDVFCNIGWGGTQKFLNAPDANMNGKLAFGPTPGGVVDGTLLVTPYFNWGWNYVVTTGSKEAELAYLFALFASSPVVSAQSVRQQKGFFDPFRSEHYSDPAIETAYSRAFLDVHRDSLTGAIPDLYLANQSEYFNALNQYLQYALNGELSAQKALERVEQKWEFATSRSGRSQQIERWLQLRAKYPENVRRHLTDIKRV